MKIFLSMLMCSFLFFSGDSFAGKEKKASRSVSSVLAGGGSRHAAENLILGLFGRKGDPVNSVVMRKPNTFQVTVGNGGAASGAAVYLVEFKNLNLNGAEPNEVVTNIEVKFIDSN